MDHPAVARLVVALLAVALDQMVRADKAAQTQPLPAVLVTTP